MSKKCEDRLLKKAKKIIDRAEAKRLIEEMENSANEKVRNGSTTKGQALRDTAKELTNELTDAQKFEKYNRFLNIIKKSDATEMINSFKDKGRGLQAFLDGVQSNIKNSRMSVGALQKSNRQKFLNDLVIRLLKDDTLETFKSRHVEEELAGELWEEGFSKNESIKKVAGSIKEVFKMGRKLMRKEGVPIGELDEYMGRQTHNPEKMLHTADTYRERMRRRVQAISQTKSFEKARLLLREESFLKWRNFIESRLDWTRIKYSGDRLKFLKSAYDSLTTGIHLNSSEPTASVTEPVTPKGEFKFKGPANLAKKITAPRLLHFKDGKTWFEYNRRYGSDTVQNAIISTLSASAESLGLIQKMGTNPGAFLDDIIEGVVKSERTNPKIKKSIKFARDIFAELDGSTKIVVGQMSAKIGRMFRSGINMSKLGLVTLTALTDLAPRAALMREHGIGFLDRYGEGVSSILEGKGDKDKRILAAMIGTYSDSHIANMNAYFANADTPAGGLSKMQQLFFKLTGNKWWDEVNRSGIGMTLSKNLAMLREDSFSSLPKGEQRILRLYGIEEKEWDLFRNNGVKPHGNEVFITPDSANDFSVEDIASYLGKEVKDVSNFLLDKTRTDLEDRMRTYFIDQTDAANLQPSASDRAFFIRGTQPGTLWGEFARYVAQFKFYTLAFTKRVMGRTLVGHGDDGIKDSILSGNADILGLIEVMISATAIGYVSMSTKDIAKNRIPRDPRLAKTWIAALLQGGGIGILGDFLFGEYSRFGKSFTKTLLGPAVGTIDDVAKIMSQLRDMDDPSNSVLHLIENNTPFINLWFTRTILNYLFLDRLQERISPGYKRRMKRRLEKENGQKFLFNP